MKNEYFQIPNYLWDLDLDVYERAVLTHIVRKTIGRGKVKDCISLNQFSNDLKISKPKVISTLESLQKRGLIIKEMQKNENGSQGCNCYFISDFSSRQKNKKRVKKRWYGVWNLGKITYAQKNKLQENSNKIELRIKKQTGWNKARVFIIVGLIISIIRVGSVDYRRLNRFFQKFEFDKKIMAKLLSSFLPNEKWILIMDRTNWKLGKRKRGLRIYFPT